MSESVVINGTTYNGVDALALVRSDGTVVTFYPDAVRYNAQNLTEAQKAQARENIGAQAKLTEADKETIVQQVIAALGTPVFGRVDVDNNIILTGELADGIYTVAYEDKDGNIVEIGELSNGSTGPVTTNIPLNMALGIKLSKTDDSYTTVSTDHTTVTETYAASQYIDLDSAAVYKVGMTYSNYNAVSLCYFDANNNLVGYGDNVIRGPKVNEVESLEHTLVIPSGATKVRLRVWLTINSSNPASSILNRSGLWMTKTI